MNVSGKNSAASPAHGAGASGIGLEFVRPMGVPPYAPAADEKSSAEQTHKDGSADAAASANQPNIYGGGLDLKA